MKNLKTEYKNKIYIVIGLIIIILLLLGALIFFGQQEQYKTPKENSTTTNNTSNKTSTSTTTSSTIDNISSTTSSNIENKTTTTSTTTTTKALTDNEIAYNIIKKYIDAFYVENYIKGYEINSIDLLDEVECHNYSKDENKIYAQVSFTYEKINLNVEINPNEELISDNIFSLDLIFVINKTNNKIENMKKIC